MNLDFEIFSAIRFLLNNVFTLSRLSERESIKQISLLTSVRYDLNQLNVEMCNPYALSFVKRMEWFTRSKALDRSNINVPIIWLLSMAVIRSSMIHMSEV